MIVLDTHAWIWWATGSTKLPTKVRRRLAKASNLGLCPISCWEVAMLCVKGRLKLNRDPLTWVREALRLPGLSLLNLDHDTAVEAAMLSPFGGDPGDCLIIATCRALSAPLVTADQRIAGSGLVKVVW